MNTCLQLYNQYKQLKESEISRNSSLTRLCNKSKLNKKNQPVKPITYSAIKSGLLGITKYTSTYWAKEGVRCNALSPGGILDGQDKKFKNKDKIVEKHIPVKNTTSGKFFSYLVVSTISFVAIIILIDTLKVTLINIFPGLEIILFNLFEILKDIKLFIIDLK